MFGVPFVRLASLARYWVLPGGELKQLVEEAVDNLVPYDLAGDPNLIVYVSPSWFNELMFVSYLASAFLMMLYIGVIPLLMLFGLLVKPGEIWAPQNYLNPRYSDSEMKI